MWLLCDQTQSFTILSIPSLLKFKQANFSVNFPSCLLIILSVNFFYYTQFSVELTLYLLNDNLYLLSFERLHCIFFQLIGTIAVNLRLLQNCYSLEITCTYFFLFLFIRQLQIVIRWGSFFNTFTDLLLSVAMLRDNSILSVILCFQHSTKFLHFCFTFLQASNISVIPLLKLSNTCQHFIFAVHSERFWKGKPDDGGSNDLVAMVTLSTII